MLVLSHLLRICLLIERQLLAARTRMDVDEVDGQLAQALSCMRTADREALIQQFISIINQPIEAETCAFFLDMNQW